MNGMSTFTFNKANISKFFFTPTNGLTTKQGGLVKTLGTDFQHAAEAVVETVPTDLAGPIINDMIGAYGKSVAFIINGWGGNV